MNKILRVYTELDGFFDFRRAMLQWLMTKSFVGDELRQREGDRMWDQHIARNYRDRRMDTFEYPGLGITSAAFKEAYESRGIEHFLMAYPTNLPDSILAKVIELEQLEEKPIAIKAVELFVNLFPFKFDKQMEDDFIAHCNTVFGGRFEVRLLNVDTREAEPNYYRQFQYVFKYDLMAESNKKFQTNLLRHPNPDTAFIVPDILARDTEAFQGPVADQIFAYSLTVGTMIRLIPISHDFYDCATFAK